MSKYMKPTLANLEHFEQLASAAGAELEQTNLECGRRLCVIQESELWRASKFRSWNGYVNNLEKQLKRKPSELRKLMDNYRIRQIIPQRSMTTTTSA